MFLLVEGWGSGLLSVGGRGWGAANGRGWVGDLDGRGVEVVAGLNDVFGDVEAEAGVGFDFAPEGRVNIAVHLVISVVLVDPPPEYILIL